MKVAGPKHIRFSKLAWDKMWGMTLRCKGEVSGFGLMSATDPNYVEDLYLVEQSCTGSTTEMDSTALAMLFADMNAQGIDPSRWRLWWHSHATMKTFFSGTDEDNVERYASTKALWSVVTNIADAQRVASGLPPTEMYIRVDNFDPDNTKNTSSPMRFTIESCTWSVDNFTLVTNSWFDESMKKIKSPTPPVYQGKWQMTSPVPQYPAGTTPPVWLGGGVHANPTVAMTEFWENGVLVRRTASTERPTAAKEEPPVPAGATTETKTEVSGETTKSSSGGTANTGKGSIDVEALQIGSSFPLKIGQETLLKTAPEGLWRIVSTPKDTVPPGTEDDFAQRFLKSLQEIGVTSPAEVSTTLYELRSHMTTLADVCFDIFPVVDEWVKRARNVLDKLSSTGDTYAVLQLLIDVTLANWNIMLKKVDVKRVDEATEGGVTAPESPSEPAGNTQVSDDTITRGLAPQEIQINA